MSSFRESFAHWRVTEDTVFITTLRGTQYLYLLEGKEQALLIDTGWGYGDLRNYVERLTNLPVLVVNTHGHPDHVGGNGWWPEIHIHRDAADLLGSVPGLPSRRQLPYPEYNKVFIGEGFVFHLGGRDVEVIEAAAHAPGSVALLDRATGMLFTGDEVEAGQVLLFDYDKAGAGVLKEKAGKHLNNMLKLRERKGEVTFLCPSHNGAPISPSYIDDFVEIDGALLQDRAQLAPALHHWYLSRLPFARELRRATSGRASVIFRV